MKFRAASVWSLILFVFLAPALGDPAPKASPVKVTRGRLKQAKKRVEVPVPADAVDSIVAVVDGEPLAMSDLASYVIRHREGLKAVTDGAGPEEILKRGSQAGRRILEQLIQETMLGKEAQAAGISATAEEIASYVEEVRKQNHVDEKTFDEILSQRGISKERYLEQVKDDIVRARLVSAKVRSKLNVLDDEINRAAKANSRGGSSKGGMHLEQILLRSDTEEPDDLELLLEKTQRLHESASEEESLKEVDEESYSDLGTVRPSDLRPELEKAARRLEPGKITPVICYEAVCAFIRRVLDSDAASEEKEEAPILSDSERESIRKQLFEEKFQLALDHYLKVELPEKYQVETKW